MAKCIVCGIEGKNQCESLMAYTCDNHTEEDFYKKHPMEKLKLISLIGIISFAENKFLMN